MASSNSIVFFATTLAVLYRVEWDGKKGQLSITLIATHRLFHSTGRILRSGKFVGLRNNGMVTYVGAQRKSVEEYERCYHIDNTDCLVGLFLDEDEARRCINEKWIKLLDPRFRTQTKAVLAAIGDDHPVFVISPGSFVYPESSTP